jgi:hypothetical protein
MTTSELPYASTTADGQPNAALPRRPTNSDLYEEGLAKELKSPIERKRKIANRLRKNRILIAGMALVIAKLARILRGTPVADFCDEIEMNDSPYSSDHDVVRLSINYFDHDNTDIKAAVCFKTLFGSIDIGLVIQWAGKT